MAIKLPLRPDDAQVVEKITYANSSEATPDIVTIEHGDGSSAFAAQPYPVYVSDLERLRANRFFDDAVLAGWQYVIFRGDKILALASAATVGVPPRLAYTSLADGEFAKNVVRTIYRADEVVAGRASDFELRVLNAPSVYLRAVWLRADTEADDLLFVIPPVPAGFEAGRPYTQAQIVEALQPVAKFRGSSTDEFPRE